MRAMVYDKYGGPDVLRLEKMGLPEIQGEELLIRMHAASVNWLDWHFLTGKPFMARMLAGGPFGPKHRVLGIDLAGRVEAVGGSVARFKPGDRVFGSTKRGCFAEYASVHQDEIHLLPANRTFEEGASVGAAASTAIRGLREEGALQTGQKVLINGASGGVGTFALQIAKALGAEVTTVSSQANFELVRSLGADKVIDYTQTDFTQGHESFDLIYDVVANQNFSRCRRVLNPGGVYVTTAFSPALLVQAWWSSKTGDKRAAPVAPKAPSRKDLADLAELLSTGKIQPVIDRRYPLGDLPEALLYLSNGHVRGKVIISILND